MSINEILIHNGQSKGTKVSKEVQVQAIQEVALVPTLFFKTLGSSNPAMTVKTQIKGADATQKNAL